MRKLLTLAAFAILSCAAHGSVCATLSANPSQSTIQSALNSCGAGNTVQMVAGSTTVTSAITMACGVTLTGPVATPATAKITTSTGSISLLKMTGGCTSGTTTVEYLQLDKAGAMNFDGNSYSNFNFLHNQATAIPGGQGCGGGCQSVQLSLGSVNTYTNFTFEYNTFGDSNSCTATINIDDGGCAGILVFNQNNNYGHIVNFVAEYNEFYHLNEAIHFLGTNYPNSNYSDCNGCYIEYNYFHGVHRMGVEFQIGVLSSGNPVRISNNVFGPPTNSYYESYATSMPCCQNTTNGSQTTTVPAAYFQNNIDYADPGSGQTIIWGVEAWGTGAQYTNNLQQGSVCAGFIWGFASQSFSISNNTQQSTIMATQAVCPTYSGLRGTYVGSEDGASHAPIQTGNVHGSNPTTAITSITPTISPTPTGTYSAPITVTLSDPGYTTGSIPQGNTTIYYTTDGSTPSTSSAVCNIPPATSCTFSVAQGSTVRAIAMWGTAPQPTSYPTSYGFVPSAQASAFYTAGSTPTLTGVSLSLPSSSIVAGNSIQACANMTYTGPQTTQVCGGGADIFGTTPNTWASSSTGTATINSTGNVTAIAAGSTNLSVKAGSFTATAVPLTVTAAAPVLAGVTITCASSIKVGQTTTCTALCNYNSPTTPLDCTTLNAYGTAASGWTSSVTADATFSSNVLTGVAVGSTNATVHAGSFTSSPQTVTITSNAPPATTLTSVSITCGLDTVVAGSTLNCTATCGYSDSTTTNCTTTDAHGTLAGTWTSSNTGTGTISSSGVFSGLVAGSTNLGVSAGSFTATPVGVTVTAIPPSTGYLGNNLQSINYNPRANYMNSTYAKTGSAALGYTVGTTCNVYLGAGTQTNGALRDCNLIAATSGTAQATSTLCSVTYTSVGTTAPGGWLAIPWTCNVTLPPNTGYWVGTVSNDTAKPPLGFWGCGSSCNGSLPTFNNGTYNGYYISNNQGTTMGMGTAMTAEAGNVQASVYVTLTSVPTLTSAYLMNPGPTTILSVGGSVQFYASCNYSDGTSKLCYPTPDQYGNTVTAFTSDTPSVMTIGDIGSANPGLAIGVSVGSANAQATMTGGTIVSSPWNMTVSNIGLPYPPATARSLR